MSSIGNLPDICWRQTWTVATSCSTLGCLRVQVVASQPAPLPFAHVPTPHRWERLQFTDDPYHIWLSHGVVERERPSAANVGHAGQAAWWTVAGVSCMTSVQSITVNSWEESHSPTCHSSGASRKPQPPITWVCFKPLSPQA